MICLIKKTAKGWLADAAIKTRQGKSINKPARMALIKDAKINLKPIAEFLFFNFITYSPHGFHNFRIFGVFFNFIS